MTSIIRALRSHSAAERRVPRLRTPERAPRPGRVDALVTDVHTRWGLAGVRDLGRAGLRVLAVGHQQSAAGVWSRHAASWALGPDSITEPEDFVRGIVELGEAHGPLVLYPSGESAIDALLLASHEVPPAIVLPYPDLDALAVLRDKRELPRLAESAGLTTPATLMEVTAAELGASPPPVPFVVKQVLPHGALHKKTRIIESADDLEALVT